MFKSWRLGTLFGFPIELNVSFLILLALVLVAFGGVAGVVIVCFAFASILLHELGHAIVARMLNVHVAGIELGFFGGAAKMVEMPRSGNAELAIAAAGPAVSLALGGASLGVGALLNLPFVSMIGWINLVIAGFNLIPALPMDGGRILRALLTKRLDFVRATDVSVIVAKVAAVAFAVVGVYVGAFQLLLLAPYLWMMASRERLIARMMADDYAGFGRNGVEVLRHERSPHGGFGTGFGSEPVRYRVVQRGGRMVIETIP
ncbi:MAG: site-2 protease family protein [Deltaproteobacteria bacterium]|nr:site-2 protease family protein [Deltaproteobacteria bacterium]